MIKRFLNWIVSFFRYKKVYKAKIVEDIPENLDDNKVYIIQNDEYSWQAIMTCPCGCKNALQMNLMKQHHPSWKYEISKNHIVTLHPSIKRMVGCKSHFFVRRGEIIWA